LAKFFVYCHKCDTYVWFKDLNVSKNDILSFALVRKTFTRKELTDYLESQAHRGTSNYLSEQLDRLLKSNLLVREDRGVYTLSPGSKYKYIPILSEELKQLNLSLKAKFPFIRICIWNSQSIIPYLHHIPNIKHTYVDVDRDATNSVFDFLNRDNPIRVFVNPDKNDFYRYIDGNESIIVRPLISEAPLQNLQGFKVPAIEKILVDIVVDIEFNFMQGVELSYFYKNMLDRHNVNPSKLLRYASRRGRRQEIEKLYNVAL